MCFPTRTGTGPHGRPYPVLYRGKAHRPLCLLSLIHTRLSWGVDTHARNHVYTILTATGVLVDAAEFPNTTAGINRAIGWVARRTEADADVLWVIEGAASYGTALTAAVTAAGYPEIGRATCSARV